MSQRMASADSTSNIYYESIRHTPLNGFLAINVLCFFVGMFFETFGKYGETYIRKGSSLKL